MRPAHQLSSPRIRRPPPPCAHAPTTPPCQVKDEDDVSFEEVMKHMKKKGVDVPAEIVRENVSRV